MENFEVIIILVWYTELKTKRRYTYDNGISQSEALRMADCKDQEMQINNRAQGVY